MADTSEYAATFELIDTNKDGLISAVEVKRLLEVIGESITDEAAVAMVGFMDSDGDGQVSLEELSAYLSQNKS
ncbi:MAG: EF-hand domain-containing protein [Actinomycetales bacterium]|nr:EF-hand domain-containing protein [Actinomycetales bacterium]